MTKKDFTTFLLYKKNGIIRNKWLACHLLRHFMGNAISESISHISLTKNKKVKNKFKLFEINLEHPLFRRLFFLLFNAVKRLLSILF